MLLRIDAATTLVLDKQLFGADGSLIEETRFTRVDFTKTPPAADFAVPQNMPAVNGPSRTKPSENVKAVVANAGFHASVPRVLPDGFSPVEGTVATIKGIRSLHVLFSDGLRTISLFENAQSSAIDLGRYHAQSATIGTTTGQYAEAGPDILLTWSKNGTHYTLVGSLPLDELERIAASM
jgi:negative regulator of sigma E activity